MKVQPSTVQLNTNSAESQTRKCKQSSFEGYFDHGEVQNKVQHHNPTPNETNQKMPSTFIRS
ncbi:hypothetical protein [Shewanella sp. D64]|uniref:hypothetical protein n=1 Tax=Shewanella sp. D64 TaxID=392163 RepID=UPI002DD68A4F|nr:hypothetical protein [Shewanella sp. D64]